jgi:ribonuclease HI
MLMLFIHRRNQIRDKVGFLAGFPPTADILKINIDGAFLQKEKNGAWGFIVRDHKGDTVLADASRINVAHDALSAESQACLAALYAAMDHGLS